MVRRRLALLLLVLASFGLGSCAEEKLTQILVLLDSDWDGFTRLEVDVSGFEKPTTVEVDLGEKPLPRRLVLVHDGGPPGPLELEVRAYARGQEEPVLVEPRGPFSFVEGETRLLRVELFYGCLEAACGTDPKQACVEGPSCVSPKEATELSNYDGPVEGLTIEYRVDAGDGLPTLDGTTAVDGGDGSTAAATKDGGDGGPDAIVDGGPSAEAGSLAYDYAPANFDPGAAELQAVERVAVDIDCAGATFNSTTRAFEDNWCGPKPAWVLVSQPEGPDAVVLVMETLTVRNGASLHLRGDLPVILAVYGNAVVSGAIDASAEGATPGPGADQRCDGGVGAPGGDQSGSDGGGGGGGGGYGSPGADGGTSGASAGGAAGAVVDAASVVPLRGGCSGGSGGLGSEAGTIAASGGGGGGAVQLSVAGLLDIAGRIAAVGGGGGGGDVQGGGGGGGSGGAILIEAGSLDFDSAVVLSVHGGGGGGGGGSLSATGDAGDDGDGAGAATSAGGAGGGSAGGGGGAAAGRGSSAVAGTDGSSSFSNNGGGGGGGGGGGRIRIQGAESCMPRGTFSEYPSVVCDSCAGGCPSPPARGCESTFRANETYFVCSSPLSWDDAKVACEGVGQALVHLEDQAENDFVAGLLSSASWIGASDVAAEGEWRWCDDDALFWSGDAAGTAGGFESWGSGEPGADNCARMGVGGNWSAAACSDVLPYVCEF